MPCFVEIINFFLTLNVHKNNNEQPYTRASKKCNKTKIMLKIDTLRYKLRLPLNINREVPNQIMLSEILKKLYCRYMWSYCKTAGHRLMLLKL